MTRYPVSTHWSAETSTPRSSPTRGRATDINAYASPSSIGAFPGLRGTRSPHTSSLSGSGVPILMLTAADRLDDKASGFGLGADDYLTKPFELRGSASRLRALDRRRAHNRPPVREIAGLRLIVSPRKVYRDGRYVALTRKQFAVLEVLVAAKVVWSSAPKNSWREPGTRTPTRSRTPCASRSPRASQAARRTVDHRHGRRRRVPHRGRTGRRKRRRRTWIGRLD